MATVSPPRRVPDTPPRTLGVCDDGAGARGWLDEGAGGEVGAESLEETFNSQDVVNTLWAYATMGREPEAGLMRELEGRSEAQ